MVSLTESPPSPTATPFKTPSKVAAAALDKFQLTSPVKMKPLIKEDDEVEVKETSGEDDLESLRKRFVGDINLPESEEPLLKESKRRFVLFPIQYNEVCFHSLVICY
jgi:ribonucleoside-diphosphate reductase subunit M2